MSASPEDLMENTEAKGFVSERGPFVINANPPVKQPHTREEVDAQFDKAAEAFDHEALSAEFGSEEARQKVAEMVRALTPGTSTTMLLFQGGANGMSLSHNWFGPNFPLFRHSHPRFGDCLYYVVGGELLMGNRKLGRGSTFFIPNGQPYKFTAGADGVEVLEFRAGGGEEDASGTIVKEKSLDAIQQIIERSYEVDTEWQVPERMGDLILRESGTDTESGDPSELPKTD